jgi:peroxiredoxin
VTKRPPSACPTPTATRCHWPTTEGGISPDPPAKLAKFRDAEKLTFPLLSDPDRKVLTAWGAYGEKQMYGKTVQAYNGG